MLDRYIRSALKDNVPRDTIDRRIKAFTEQKEAFEEVAEGSPFYRRGRKEGLHTFSICLIM